MDDLIRDINVKLADFQQEIDTLKQTLSSNVKEKESLSKTLTVLKQNLKKKRLNTLIRKFVNAKEHAVISVNDDKETLILEEESRSKMLDKQNDPISIEKKIKISPIDDSKLNKIKEDFGKRFVTQKEFSTEQAFWLKHSSFSKTLITSRTPVRIEAPSKLPKCLELETELLKKKDFIEKDVYDKLLKSYSTLEKHCISLELTTQLNQEIFQKDNFRENQNAPTFNQLFELNELKAQSQEKDTVIRKLKDKIKSLSGKDSLENVKKDIDEIKTINIELEHTLKNELRKLKGKNVVDTAISKPNATIALGMFKLDIKPISHRLQNNRDAHEIYIDKNIENTDTLSGFVKRARTQNLSEPLLESACMFIKHVQELLVYVSQTCPNSPKPSEKLVAVTPMNKDKRVRFAKHITSLSNIPKQTDSLKTIDSNKPLLTSTGVKPITSASGSKPSGNTKNNRITRPPSRNFTIIGNRCPLTRITLNKIVPPKETTITSVVTPTLGILVYNKRPKATRSVGSSSKVKIVESKTSNSKEPKQSWGSIVSDVPSYYLNDYRFRNDHIAKIMGYEDYQMGNVTISRVYHVEGLETTTGKDQSK
ncbi:hypothetical protein Tco_0770523 [Tanacetum coccineum]|uniref:Integrase, catalytic region, zinc finger, CCHC-type, peptidase aspartic, catalytic n=1 Tax=Tanacetum coccineum TaxID=301880 RepID=A0ABQ4ZDI1_9ASTR